MSDPVNRAAWSWTEHLRAGGSTPWSTWLATGHDGDVDVPAGWSPPGAAQLELVRRLSAVAGRGLPDGLVDLVLNRSGPGRGLAHLPLGRPGVIEPRPVGPPATDPADVPEEELIRVGVGVLVELLLRAPEARREWRPRRRVLRAAVGFELAGAPVTTAAVRRALALAGHVEGGPAPRVVLLAEPFDATLGQVWSARVQDGAPARWHGFVTRCAHARRLPPSADLPALARAWAARVGEEAVHVVVAPGGHAAAAQRAADVLGVPLEIPARRAARRSGPPRWVDLSPAAVDVVRRVNAVLAVRAPADHHAAAVRRLSTLLLTEGATSQDSPLLTVPARFQDWAAERARGLAEDLRAGGYAVDGDLARLVPTFTGVPTHPRREEVLGLVVAACVRQAGEHPRTTKERHR